MSSVQPGKRELAVFFSHGISLETWERAGLLTKEVAYYAELSSVFGPVLFVTYDVPSTSLEARLNAIAPITGIYNRWRLPYRIFGIVAPLQHWSRLRRCAVLKSNQLSGAWTAVLAKWLLRKPLVVRCGYVPSRSSIDHHTGFLRRFLIIAAERMSLRAADLVFTATEADASFLAAKHGLSRTKVRLIPTPIDTDRFADSSVAERDPDLVLFVGRLSKEKNVALLIEACASLPGIKLRVIGAGGLEAGLRSRADAARVEFTGVVPNVDLPHHMRRASIFVLPSDYEGSPKALLEAMSAGLAVIGTRVVGIQDIIVDGVNGLLVDRSPRSVAAAIEQLRADPALRKRLGLAARRFVIDRYSQRDVAKLEDAALSTLTS